MNRFLTPLTDVIIDQQGYIDKYMGDAIMAFWNAPLDDADHEVYACEAAIQMLEQIDAVNKEREQEAATAVMSSPAQCRHRPQHRHWRRRQHGLRPEEELFGARRQREPASRLEGQSKEYGFPIIVGSRTALAAKDKFAILELDFIMVKGKTEPEVIYAIAGREDVAQSGALPAPAQSHHRDAGVLSQPRLGRRAGRDRARPQAATRRDALEHALQALRGAHPATIKMNPPPDRLERRLRAADEVATAGAMNSAVVPAESRDPSTTGSCSFNWCLSKYSRHNHILRGLWVPAFAGRRCCDTRRRVGKGASACPPS